MKLDIDSVIKMKKLYAIGVKPEALAVRFGVTRQQIDRVIKGKQWADRELKHESALTHKKLLDSIASKRV